jgi:hypothetical protein
LLGLAVDLVELTVTCLAVFGAVACGLAAGTQEKRGHVTRFTTHFTPELLRAI